MCRSQNVGSYEEAGEVSYMELQKGHEDLCRKVASGHSSCGFPGAATLDFSAAFDTIDHSTLLNRLNKSFGIAGCSLAWIESYLSERYQCVRSDQASSPRTLCHTGVPQGSVLGPLLFSCYISPISSLESAFGVNVQQCADNTQIYIPLTASDVAAELSRLSSCLSVLHNWFCDNGLALNSSKSESIIFGTRQRLHNFPTVSPPSISGSTIEISETIKILGVTLDNSLTLKQHTRSLSAEISASIPRHIRPALTGLHGCHRCHVCCTVVS